jgi:apolipoprotein N-acyltransferase
MQPSDPCPVTPGWSKSFLWLALAVACFHAAYYDSGKFPAAGLLIIGYAFGLVQLASQPSVRRAFYFGFTAGFLCAAPQLYFFWKIFSVAAIVLWIVFAFWIGLFTAIVCGCLRRWGKTRAMWLIPFIWTGLEYFRSKLYYLKFSCFDVFLDNRDNLLITSKSAIPHRCGQAGNQNAVTCVWLVLAGCQNPVDTIVAPAMITVSWQIIP